MYDLRMGAFRVFNGYIGTKEPTGNNDGEQINKAQRLLGLKEGSATEKGDLYCAAMIWCAVAVAYAVGTDKDPHDEAELKRILHHLSNVLPISASVGAIRDKAIEQKNFVAFTKNYAPRRGDLVLFDFGKGQRHIGMVMTDTGDGRLSTIEANTSYEPEYNAETNDPQGGVWKKMREKRAGFIIGYINMPDSVV